MSRLMPKVLPIPKRQLRRPTQWYSMSRQAWHTFWQLHMLLVAYKNDSPAAVVAWAFVELSFSRRGSEMGCCWGGVANPREWALPNAAAGPLELTQNPLIVKAPPLRWPVKAPPPVLLAKGGAPKAAPVPGLDLYRPPPPVKAPPVGYAAALPRQR